MGLDGVGLGGSPGIEAGAPTFSPSRLLLTHRVVRTVAQGGGGSDARATPPPPPPGPLPVAPAAPVARLKILGTPQLELHRKTDWDAGAGERVHFLGAELKPLIAVY